VSTQVKLEIFEGPLDLLLHLVKKNEVSVSEIPIATITEQYMTTLELMQALNLDVAGEFLVMAATLVHIKSRMLLPPDGEVDEDEEPSDTREDLIRRLLEYQRFKDAAAELSQREILARDVFIRGSSASVEVPPGGFREVSIFELLTALRQVLERLPKEDAHEVTLERITMREKMTLVLDTLRSTGKVVFESLFSESKSRIEVIVTFLAVLELVKVRAIRIFQDNLSEPIVLEAAVEIGAAMDRVSLLDMEEEPHGT
jgi:segregation and condensation protein A